MSDVFAEMANQRTANDDDRAATNNAIVAVCDDIGIRGELAFGEFSGLCPDLSVGMKSDGGVDFVVPLLYTVDVKAAKGRRNLIYRTDRPLVADIYVLADVEGGKATLAGWAWKSQLERAEVRDLGHGKDLRVLPRKQLRPMSDLEARLWKTR